MIKCGRRNIKKLKDSEYLYYMYYNKNGKRIAEYCGRVGDIQTEINALEIEYGIRIEVGSENDKRLKEIETSLKHLNKRK